jgi:hypothetical protein
MGLVMAAAHTAFDGRALTIAALAAANAFGFAANPAAAAAPAWLRHALHRTRQTGEWQAAPPPVARYTIDEGGVFVLDRSARYPLIKFDDSPEVWVLYPSRAPRGDIIYKNDMGEPMLRATKLGGMTVFTPRRPGGSAAALDGAGVPLRVPPLGPAALWHVLFQASIRCTRAGQHLIGIEALDVSSASDGLVADAAQVTSEAMAELAARPDGKALLASVAKVAFVEGGGSNVAVHGGVVTITVVPSQGLAGRPSSQRIMRAIGAQPIIRAIGSR